MPIHRKPGEQMFEDRYQWLTNGGDLELERRKDAVARKRAGEAPYTVDELGRYYCKFVDEAQRRGEYSPHTIQHYLRFTNRFVHTFGVAPLHTIETHHLTQILSDWSNTDNAWNNCLRAIKHLFKYAEKHWGLKPNPTKELEKKKVNTDGFPPWEDEHLEAFFTHHKLGTRAYLTMMLLIHAAPRRADIVGLGPANIIEIEGKSKLGFNHKNLREQARFG